MGGEAGAGPEPRRAGSPSSPAERTAADCLPRKAAAAQSSWRREDGKACYPGPGGGSVRGVRVSTRVCSEEGSLPPSLRGAGCAPLGRTRVSEAPAVLFLAQGLSSAKGVVVSGHLAQAQGPSGGREVRRSLVRVLHVQRRTRECPEVPVRPHRPMPSSICPPTCLSPSSVPVRTSQQRPGPRAACV